MEFKLTKACEVAFQCCKDEISKNITLPYYNLKTSMILQTDASKKGLGAVLLQNSTPVMFASRALTGSERNYQNLEKSVWQLYGAWKIPLLSIWQGVHFGDKSETICIHIQETHGGNFSKDPEVSSEKLPISTLQHQVQERSGNSTSRCSK